MLALGLSADRSASVAGGRHRRWLAARLVWVALVVAALVAAVGEGAGAAPDPSCATPFRVFTDPADPGTATVHGPITTVRDSGVLGAFSGEGRFAGYTLAGDQDLIVNGVNNRANVHGVLVATSPDGGSSFTLTYTGEVDLVTGVATGHFVAGDGNGALDGFHAVGTIAAQLVGPATFDGADIGLC